MTYTKEYVISIENLSAYASTFVSLMLQASASASCTSPFGFVLALALCFILDSSLCGGETGDRYAER